MNSTAALNRAIRDARDMLDAPEAVQGTSPVVPLQVDAAPAPVTVTRPRHLRAVLPSKRRKPSALAGALTAVCIVLAILATQLGLSIVVSRGAYETRALQLEQRDLLRVERVLSQNLDKLASPQNLAENAAALGMVQNATPATLRLSDSTVLGDLTPRTSAVTGNIVPNATLTNLPVVDADGLLVARGGQAETVAAEVTGPPVVWEGKLPAPDTH